MRAAQRAEALLALMLSDQPSAWMPTPFWKQHIPEILRDIALYGIEHFYAHPSAQHLYAGGTDLTKAARDYATLAPPPVYSQSNVGLPDRLYEVDGRGYSLTALNYLRGLAFLNRPVRSVLEIGGGFGCLGDILLQTTAGGLYVNIDIPPLAAIATYYLEELWGMAVLDYGQTRGWETIDLAQIARKYRAVVLCPWQLSRIQGTVELGVNFLSFQEMEPETVQTYADELNRLGIEHLLLRNSISGKPGTDTPVTRNTVLNAFDNFTLLSKDGNHYGDTYHGLVSEVIHLKRVR